MMEGPCRSCAGVGTITRYFIRTHRVLCGWARRSREVTLSARWPRPRSRGAARGCSGGSSEHGEKVVTDARRCGDMGGSTQLVIDQVETQEGG